MGFRNDHLVHDADEFLFERRIVLLADRPKISRNGIVLEHTSKDSLHVGCVAVVARIHFDNLIPQSPGPGDGV